MTRRALLVLASVLGCLPAALTSAASAAGGPTAPPFAATAAEADRGDGVVARAGTVTVTDPTDGPVPVDTTLYLPRRTPAPAVLLSHGFGGSKDSLDSQATRLARSGLVVLTWSAPGFGRSGGSISLMSLDHEVPDARQLIDHLAAQPEVTRDGPGDPRVGVAGGSYGGAASLLVAGTDRRVDAVAAAITWNDLSQALFPDEALPGPVGGSPAPQATASTAGTGPLKKGWASALFASGFGARPGGANQPGGGNQSGAGSAGLPGGTSGQAACGRFRIEYCLAYAASASSGRLSVQLRALLARSSPATVLAGVRAPTLLIQGQQDTLFGLDQAEANLRGLAAAGVPVTVGWYAGGHDAGSTGQSGVERQMASFLTAHLGAAASPSAVPATGTVAFSYDLTGPTDPTTGNTATRAVQTDGYPAADQDVTRRLAVTGGRQQIVRPPGGQPAALTAVTGVGVAGLGGTGGSPSPGGTGGGNSTNGANGRTGNGSGAATAAGSTLLGASAAEPPGQTAVFATEPLADPLTLTGQPRIRLVITQTASLTAGTTSGSAGSDRGDGPLFARLVDIGPDEARRLLGPGASPFTVPGLRSGRYPGPTREVTVALPGAVATIERGHRLAVSVVPTDASFSFPATGAAYSVALARGTELALPSVPASGNVDPAAVRTSLPRFPLVGGAVVLLLLAAVAAVFLVRRVRGGRADRPGPPAGGDGGGDGLVHRSRTGPEPLVVAGFVKSYADGFRAVDGVSFRARPGQVLGLLGPNGAGKTTTLRILLGLLRPTAGQVLVFGRPVTPGAPVLARVGAFVEGPGVLPHLTGRGNLRSYWAATGRPEQEAGIDDALAVAGLGRAVDRRVRTYSQGMRQRLAIAQAMLGTPDLLVLDEPTNGLDPPQIAQMRRVLRRYAAAGRTVVVSSHLLAEVEQTCDHVVVMARGKVVADAAVADLVGRSGPTLFEVDDEPAAVRVLFALAGVGPVSAVPRPDTRPDGRSTAGADAVLSAELGGVPRPAVVAALVEAGVGVAGVRSRNRLEDVFLQLVAPPGPAPTPVPHPVGAAAS